MSEREIGELAASVDSLKNQTTDLFKKADSHTETLTRIETLLTVHVQSSEKRHDDIEQELSEVQSDVGECKKGVEEYRSDKKGIKWVVASVSAVLAVVWNGAIKLIESVFS